MAGGRSSRVRSVPNTREVRERLGPATGDPKDDLLVNGASINQLTRNQRAASSLRTGECFIITKMTAFGLTISLLKIYF